MAWRWPIFLMPISLRASISSFSPSPRETISSRSSSDVISSSSNCGAYCSSLSSASISPVSAHRSDARGLVAATPPVARIAEGAAGTGGLGGAAGSSYMSAFSLRIAACSSKYISLADASSPNWSTVRSRKAEPSCTSLCDESAFMSDACESWSTESVRVYTLSFSADTSSETLSSIPRYASPPWSATHCGRLKPCIDICWYMISDGESCGTWPCASEWQTRVPPGRSAIASRLPASPPIASIARRGISPPMALRNAETLESSRSTMVAPSSMSSSLVRSNPASSGTRLMVRILSILQSWMTACPVGMSAQFCSTVSPGFTLP
mmetsp:Transcript_16637/g.45136  ORF Transcript_16637/g.45136 Transcript_16637/m.45136 type:complete len:323 (-) Transcript_16637:863-1831(-)